MPLGPADIVATTLTAPAVTTSTAGLAPASGGGTANFLRADGSWQIPPGTGGVTGVALTKTDDTNVTLALGGTPTTALLQATSITAGWTGTLAVARGGTGASDAATALTNLGVVAASTTVAGISEMATFAENITGTDATRALTPDSQHTKITHLGTQHSNSTATPTEVTGLTQTLVAGAYRFSFWLICQSATAGTGLTFNVNFTGTVTRMVAMLSWPDTGVSAALGAVDDSANVATGQVVAHAVTTTKATSAAGNLTTGTVGVATAGANVFLQVEGVVVVSTGGSFALWHGSETTTATTVEVGSSLMMTRVN